MAELWKGSIDSFAPIPYSVTENMSVHAKDKIIYFDSQPHRCLRNLNEAGIERKGMGKLNQMLCLILLLLCLLNVVWRDEVLCCLQHFVHKNTVTSFAKTPQFSIAVTWCSQVPETAAKWMVATSECPVFMQGKVLKTWNHRCEHKDLLTLALCAFAVLPGTSSPVSKNNSHTLHKS